MKYSEIQKSNDLQTKLDDIDRRWSSLAEFSWEHETTVVQHLFVLNGGGSAASLAYIAAKGTRLPYGVTTALCLFGAGLLLHLLRSAIAYYRADRLFRKYKFDLTEFYDDKIEWDEFLSRDDTRSRPSCILHFLAWASAMFFITGLIIGSIGVLGN